MKFVRNKWALLCLYFVVTLLLDHLIFDFGNLNVFNYVILKGVFFIFLILLLKNYKKMRFLKTKFFWVFCIIFGVLFIFLYPGSWLGSDIYLIYDKAIMCDYYYHLNYLTTVFYIFSFMLIPLPVAPVIMQILLSAVVFSYVAEKTRITFCLGNKRIWILLVPFVLAHSIFYILYPNRPIIFGLLALSLYVTLFCDYYRRQNFVNSKIIVAIAFVTAVLSNIRAEAVFLVLVIPLLVFITYRIKPTRKNILKYGLLFLLLFIGIGIPQKAHELFNQSEYERQIRKLPSYISPLSLMLSDDEISVTEEEIMIIDKVLNVKDLKNYASYYDVPCIWRSEQCVRVFNEEEFKSFQRTFLSIIFRNKRLFLDAKFKVFWASTSLGAPDHFTTFDIFQSEDDILLQHPSMKPVINYNLRRDLYRVLEGKTDSEFINVQYLIFNNLIICLVAIVVSTVYFMYKRRSVPIMINIVVLGNALIVFLTAPAAYFMYYFYAYLWGWYMICLLLMKCNFGRKVWCSGRRRRGLSMI